MYTGDTLSGAESDPPKLSVLLRDKQSILRAHASFERAMELQPSVRQWHVGVLLTSRQAHARLGLGVAAAASGWAYRGRGSGCVTVVCRQSLPGGHDPRPICARTSI